MQNPSKQGLKPVPACAVPMCIASRNAKSIKTRIETIKRSGPIHYVSCRNAKSIKTRIETDIIDPILQGISVAMQNPSKQGLKPYACLTIRVPPNSRNAKSIKTRIETKPLHPCHSIKFLSQCKIHQNKD